MTQELKIVVPEHGVPYAEVPCQCMWELIEYLSFQRVAVNYDFKTTHFTVAFPKLGSQRAQELLDQWSHAGAEYAEAV